MPSSSFRLSANCGTHGLVVAACLPSMSSLTDSACRQESVWLRCRSSGIYNDAASLVFLGMLHSLLPIFLMKDDGLLLTPAMDLNTVSETLGVDQPQCQPVAYSSKCDDIHSLEPDSCGNRRLRHGTDHTDGCSDASLAWWRRGFRQDAVSHNRSSFNFAHLKMHMARFYKVL